MNITIITSGRMTQAIPATLLTEGGANVSTTVTGSESV